LISGFLFYFNSNAQKLTVEHQNIMEIFKIIFEINKFQMMLEDYNKLKLYNRLYGFSNVENKKLL
jgi:hypothetical protein